MIELELRNCPTPFIPGWAGHENVAYGNYDDDGLEDRIVVADIGGSARVMVFHNPHGAAGEFNAEREWPVLLNAIVFEPTFRGGGRLKVVPAGDGLDAILIAPGPGGGPAVARLDQSGVFYFFAPYERDFRGGMWVSTGDIDGDGDPEALFLPGDGGSPRLLAIDMRTFETELSIFVGDPQDTSGRARFEPTGGTIHRGPDLFFYIQYGDVVDNRAESALIPVSRR